MRPLLSLIVLLLTLGLTAPDAVIGLSRGEGIPPFFYSTDLTGEGAAVGQRQTCARFSAPDL